MLLPVNGLIQAFRTIVGWPYASPGSNDQRGIDCSGAFVYAYRRFGKRIYHGSNRIIRVYCRDVQTLSSPGQLRPGMAVFRSRTDLSRMKAEYKPGGAYYDPALPNDYYHMGLVASVSPLEIIHATSPRARMDTRLDRWCCAGYLKDVDYGSPDDGPAPEESGPTPEEESGPAPPVPFSAIVTAKSGGTVNLRRSPSKLSVVRLRVPLGQTVTVLEKTDSLWWRVRHQSTAGYMMKEFLEPILPE